MNQMPSKLEARAQRKNAKRDEKKRRIAESAIEALKELGYANTSLRDIAEKSDLSLGMLHYYFEDRSDLIIFCVAAYKIEFVRTITASMTGGRETDQVIESFAAGLARSITEDSATHKLWYDIRNQAMFDATFRPVVDEIEQMLVGTVELFFNNANAVPQADPTITYSVLDGVFRHLMQSQFGDKPVPGAEMKAIFSGLLRKSLE